MEKGLSAVWLFNPHNNHIVAFDDRLNKIIDVLYSPPNGGSLLFTEGSDHKLYGVVNDTSGLKRNIVQLRYTSTSVSGGQVATLPSGWNAGYPVLIDPSGQVFFKSAQGYKRLSGTTLFDAGNIDKPYTNYTQLVEVDIDNYKAQDVAKDFYRDFFEAIGPSGRWVAADPLRTIPDTRFGSGMEQALNDIRSAASYSILSKATTYSDTLDYVSLTGGIWGNAWWNRTDHTVAWTGVSNTGLSSISRNLAMGLYLGINYIVEGMQGAAPPTLLGDLRKDRLVAGAILPTIYMDLYILYHWLPGDFGGSIGYITDTTVPHQIVKQLVSDGIYLYLLSVGRFDNITESYHVHGLYRAPIPAEGSAPTWTQLIAEPSESGWNNLAVSEKWLWLARGNYLDVYTKAGIFKKTVFQATSGIASLTTAWNSRWK